MRTQAALRQEVVETLRLRRMGAPSLTADYGLPFITADLRAASGSR